MFDRPLDKMSRAEKIMAMEALWQDLSRDEDALPSPEWHEEALKETERRLSAGQEEFVDWEEAKKKLRGRFE